MKKFRVFLLALCSIILISSVCLPVFAKTEVPYFSYDGRSKEFTLENAKDGNLFQDYNSVMPGDILSQGIVVEGKHIKDSAKLYLKLGEGFNLPSGVKLMIYDDSKLLYNSAEHQGEKILLHAFQKDEKVELLVVLDVYVEAGNEIADTQESVEWTFVIEDEGEEISLESPKTGENGLLITSVFVLGFSVLGVIFLLLGVKKKGKIAQKPRTSW